jgi:hypothetical protein
MGAAVAAQTLIRISARLWRAVRDPFERHSHRRIALPEKGHLAFFGELDYEIDGLKYRPLLRFDRNATRIYADVKLLRIAAMTNLAQPFLHHSQKRKKLCCG